MAVKFITVKGSSSLTATPYYVGVPQHERIHSKEESYEKAAEYTGYKATSIQAIFQGLRNYLVKNANRGNSAFLDQIATIRNFCKGSFDTISGPWVKGRNYLTIGAVELDPFKKAVADIIPENKTEGMKPAINTVYDKTTGLYSVITGTNVFDIAGSDLGPDSTKADEGVYLRSESTGVETKCVLQSSDLQLVTAKLAAALTAGKYRLIVRTRSGMGEEFGVSEAIRLVDVVAAA